MSSPIPSPKRNGLSLRVTILTMMVVILAVLAIGLLQLGGHAGREAILVASRDHMSTVETLVAERLENTFGQAESQVPLLATLPALKTAPKGTTHAAEDHLRKLMLATPGIHHLFAHYPDGTFLRVIDLADATPEELRELKAPAKTNRVMQIRFRDRDGFYWTLWRYEDARGATIDALLEDGTKDQPPRPAWVEGVLEAGGPVSLPPRRGEPAGQPVLTVAAPIEGVPGAIVGVDVALIRLSSFLRAHLPTARSRLIVMDKKGTVTASQDVDRLRALWGTGDPESPLTRPRLLDLQDPVLDALRFHLLARDKAEDVEMALDGEDWMVRVMPLKHGPSDQSWILLATPIAEVEGPLIDITRQGAAYSLIIVLASVPLVLLGASLISSPLRRLTQAAEAIRGMELAKPVSTRSHITEVDRLATTMEAMRSGVETFTRYVPRTLAERAIASGRGAELGGDRREITLLFTDVEGFTTLADGRDPETTMADASAYFEVLGQAIQTGGGVIDKFIGDAVMALWNAPEPNPHHARDACRGLLGAQAAVTAWNLDRVSRGEPPFPTRFGLHGGPVVVGNLGTHDRVNYTAVGATVNMAARLEGLNKVYGTTALVGDSTRTAAQAEDPDLLFRAVDRVVPKGARSALEVHDLIDPTWEAMGRVALRAYVEDWDAAVALYRAREWTQAETAFRELAHRRPREPLAGLYLGRIADWRVAPPPGDWTATVHIDRK